SGRRLGLLVLAAVRREEGSESHRHRTRQHARVKEHVDGAPCRRAVRARSGAGAKQALGQVGAGILERAAARGRFTTLAHLPTTMRWPKAASTFSQKARQAAYSFGWMRVCLNASELLTVILPALSSTAME